MTYDVFKFINVFTDKSLPVPVILYAGDRVSTQKVDIQSHLNDLYKSRPELTSGVYHLLFMWTLKDYVMTDIWIFRQNTWNKNLGQNLGAIYVYSGKTKIEYAEIGSDRTVVTAGKEMELLRSCNFDVDKYLGADRG